MAGDKKVKVIACRSLAKDMDVVAGRLGIEITPEYLPHGLHNEPNVLRTRLQKAIDEATADDAPDLIAVGYGVCGRGTIGVRARSVPLAIPRVHDCISLFLGSDAAYRRQFDRCPGTYYITGGWVNEESDPNGPNAFAGHLGEPWPQYSEEALAEKYGRENAQAIRYFLDSWKRNYSRVAFIDTGLEGKDRYADHARRMAEDFDLEYAELPGDVTLLSKVLTATETTDDVLFVPPGHVIAHDAAGKRLTAAACE